MKSLNTKEGREQSRSFQFAKLIEQGYIQDTHKGLEIFTKEEGGKFYLKTFWGTSSHLHHNFYYTKEDQRIKRIADTKSSYDRSEAWKAERKESNKGKRLTGAAACADAIRTELKTAFAGVKFSVKSSTYSMGESVSISWGDGPKTKEVEAVAGKYQYGHFNGMEDMYENTNIRDDIPQAKYVRTSRHMSEATKDILIKAGDPLFEVDRWAGINDVSQFIYEIFYNCSIPTGATVTGIERTGETCGSSRPHIFYKIAFATPESAPTPQTAEVPAGKVQIIDYSEKAIAVIGETTPLKDKLKELGGSFNSHLKCGAGWIFSKKRFEAIKAFLLSTKTDAQPELTNKILTHV